MVKNIGVFEIDINRNSDDNLFFDDNIKKIIMKGNMLYGTVYNDGQIKAGFFNCTHPKYINIHLNNKLYWKLWNIWQYGNDERVDELMLHYCNRNDNNNRELHFYTDFNLK